MLSSTLGLTPYQLAAACLAILVTLGFGVRTIYREDYKDILDQLNDPTDRKDWIAQLSRGTPIHVRYSLSLLKLNNYVSRIYAGPASTQALERSLILTLIYPFLLYLVGWCVGGSNKYGNLVFLGSQANGLERLFIASAYLATIFLSVVAIFRIPLSEPLFVFSNKGVFAKYKLRDWTQLAIFIFAFGLLWTINQALTSVGYAVSFVVYAILSFALYFACRTTLTRQLPSSPVIGLMIPLMLGLLSIAVHTVGLGSGTIAFVVLFFITLPVINAVFDFLSWYVTRWFLRLAATLRPDNRSYIKLVQGLSIDVLWAFICLVLLTISLGISLKVYDGFFPSHATDWRAQLQAIGVGTGAGTSGLLISGMLATTLIPTVIHIFVGAAGVLLAFAPRADQAIMLLSDQNLSTRGKQELAKTLRALKVANFVIPIAAAIIACSFPVFVASTVGPFASAIALKLISSF